MSTIRGRRTATDPAAARMVAKVRRLMLISGVTTMVAIAAVIGVTAIAFGPREVRHGGGRPRCRRRRAYRRDGGGGGPRRRDHRCGGAIEIRTFDLRTLKPTGRLRFATEPKNVERTGMHDTDTLIKRLPKCELHIHIEGSPSRS